MQPHKLCNRCQTSRPHSEFRNVTKGDRFGLHSRCRNCEREERRRHYKDNPEKYANWNRDWNQKNPEKRREIQQSRDREKQYQSHRAYIRAHPEKKAAYDHNRRALQLAAVGTITDDTIHEVFDLYGKRCLQCGVTENITIDHVIPLTLGGSNLAENLQPLCRSHNSAKGNRNSIDFRSKGDGRQVS